MSETHPAVLAVHNAARSVPQQEAPHPSASLWQRMVSPKSTGVYALVREFEVALGKLLDVPPSLLTSADIEAIGGDVNEVVQRAERAIERYDPSRGEPIEPLASAIYAIRDKYEQIYIRGAGKQT